MYPDIISKYLILGLHVFVFCLVILEGKVDSRIGTQITTGRRFRQRKAEFDTYRAGIGTCKRFTNFFIVAVAGCGIDRWKK
jgi:hypothetical protein